MTKVNRSAIDGEFVSDEVAEANPDTTVEEEVDNKPQAPAKKSKEVCFRTRLNGLSVPVANQDSADPNLIEYVRFQSVNEKFQGDPVKVGYLKTDHPRAIEVFTADPAVEVISEKEFNDAVSGKNS